MPGLTTTLTLARLTAVQNICPIYIIKVGQQFCDFFISQWGLSAPTAKPSPECNSMV